MAGILRGQEAPEMSLSRRHGHGLLSRSGRLTEILLLREIHIYIYMYIYINIYIYIYICIFSGTPRSSACTIYICVHIYIYPLSMQETLSKANVTQLLEVVKRQKLRVLTWGLHNRATASRTQFRELFVCLPGGGKPIREW